MKIYKSLINLELLLNDCRKLSYKTDGTGILMAFYQSIEIKELDKIPAIGNAIWEISRIRKQKPLYMLVNIIPTGIKAPMHADSLKQVIERWHLPIITNEDCEWYDSKNKTLWMQAGYWYGPMPYSNLHSVGNFNLFDERIHLVVDLKI